MNQWKNIYPCTLQRNGNGYVTTQSVSMRLAASIVKFLNCFFSKTFVSSLILCSSCAAFSAEKVNLKSFWVSFSKQLLNEYTQKAVGASFPIFFEDIPQALQLIHNSKSVTATYACISFFDEYTASAYSRFFLGE